MPELPEVETIVQDLQPLLLNKEIIEFNIIDPKLIQPLNHERRLLIHKQIIVNIFRRAKHLIIQLSNGYNLVIHLKMTGQIIWTKQQNWLAGGHPTKDLSSHPVPEWPNQSTRAIIKLSDQSQVFFNDSRKFGWIKLMNPVEWGNYQAKLGVEPLSPDFTLEYLQQILTSRPRSRIKPLLLEQGKVVGLGNIYVDESLFKAGIRPDRLAGQLKNVETEQLHQAIITILQLAIKHRGTSFSDYRDGRGQSGNFANQLMVYGRKDQSCQQCFGLIEKTKLAGRGTHFCSTCQQ